MRSAERIAGMLDPKRFGVAAIYVIGSTKDGTSGPASDIDLIVHFRGSDAQRKHLECWFGAWNDCLDEINYMKTGYKTGGLLDVHYVTDNDIEKKTKYAAMIDAETDPARLLELGNHD